VTTLAELLLAGDAARPRSRQLGLGWSEVGGCRRRAAYRMALTPPSDPAGNLPAVMGTAIHAAAGQASMILRAGRPGPADTLQISRQITYAGVTGTADAYDPPTVIDWKTITPGGLTRIAEEGPPRPHLWQVHGYGAGLSLAGERVRRVRIEYLDRAYGDTWTYEGPFRLATVREAVAWLTEVRAAGVDWAPRDGPGPGLGDCRSCPFRSLCWGTDTRTPAEAIYATTPDAELWAVRLAGARERKRAAERDETAARLALAALDPGDDTPVRVPGWELRYDHRPGRRTPDRDAIRAALGRVPTTRGEPSVTLTLRRTGDG